MTNEVLIYCSYACVYQCPVRSAGFPPQPRPWHVMRRPQDWAFKVGVPLGLRLRASVAACAQLTPGRVWDHNRFGSKFLRNVFLERFCLLAVAGGELHVQGHFGGPRSAWDQVAKRDQGNMFKQCLVRSPARGKDHRQIEGGSKILL